MGHLTVGTGPPPSIPGSVKSGEGRNHLGQWMGSRTSTLSQYLKKKKKKACLRPVAYCDVQCATSGGAHVALLILFVVCCRNLYSTFQSPWADSPCRPQDIGEYVRTEIPYYHLPGVVRGGRGNQSEGAARCVEVVRAPEWEHDFTEKRNRNRLKKTQHAQTEATFGILRS